MSIAGTALVACGSRAACLRGLRLPCEDVRVMAHADSTAALLLEMADLVAGLRREISKLVVGQTGMEDRILIALLANGHVLLEGVPGLATR